VSSLKEGNFEKSSIVQILEATYEKLERSKSKLEEVLLLGKYLKEEKHNILNKLN
jgi:hypothetical protein